MDLDPLNQNLDIDVVPTMNDQKQISVIQQFFDFNGTKMFQQYNQKSASIKRPLRIVVMSADNNNISVEKTPFQIRLPSSTTTTRNKVVFEDQGNGIVCYRDENGEITCEGVDEGPRFQPRISRFAPKRRDADIIDLLQRSWLQIAADNVKFH